MNYRQKLNMIILTLFIFTSVHAKENSIPKMEGAVTDTANILTATAKEKMSSYLNNVNEKTGIQVALLTVKSLNGEEIESFSMRVAENWKLGQKEKDNGVLMLLALNEHKVRIEVGYGLEGVLTDAYCGLIIRQVMIPYFRQDAYAKGLEQGLRAVVQKAAGQDIQENEDSLNPLITGTEEKDGLPLPVFAFLVIYFLIFIMGIASKFKTSSNPQGTFGSSASRTGYGGLGRSVFLGGLGGFGGSTGFGGSRHSSGGGFSGGGGSFGGGGASGSW
ncbi:TPM domain-containing protein [Treponema parvum]|uniref:TPM domain-containing protein n=1 Tax=Treponema parvum TaxID=138851 RepID=A0A975F2S5_9SPIR|nr:TPM domain-containing protein [Treponema parvum]QTQ13044.1 TPM domain-containing protein [Treponema parvum]